MRQVATVERIIDDTHAEISVPRKSACGHDCEECAGCGVTGAAVRAKAVNAIGAKPGQKVVVESDSQRMMKIIAVVYLAPVVLFLAGYLLTWFLPSEGLRYGAAALAFLAGMILAMAYDRRLRARGGLIFQIVRLF